MYSAHSMVFLGTQLLHHPPGGAVLRPDRRLESVGRPTTPKQWLMAMADARREMMPRPRTPRRSSTDSPDRAELQRMPPSAGRRTPRRRSPPTGSPAPAALPGASPAPSRCTARGWTGTAAFPGCWSPMAQPRRVPDPDLAPHAGYRPPAPGAALPLFEQMRLGEGRPASLDAFRLSHHSPVGRLRYGHRAVRHPGTGSARRVVASVLRDGVPEHGATRPSRYGRRWSRGCSTIRVRPATPATPRDKIGDAPGRGSWPRKCPRRSPGSPVPPRAWSSPARSPGVSPVPPVVTSTLAAASRLRSAASTGSPSGMTSGPSTAQPAERSNSGTRRGVGLVRVHARRGPVDTVTASA